MCTTECMSVPEVVLVVRFQPKAHLIQHHDVCERQGERDDQVWKEQQQLSHDCGNNEKKQGKTKEYVKEKSKNTNHRL